MKKAIVVNIDKGHFDYMANEMLNYYDPFSFLFIGPTGYYVRQISDKFSQKFGKAINRDAFRVINQYVVETLLRNNMDAVFFDRDFFKAFIAQKIEEYENSAIDDDSYREFIKIVSKSKGILEYILDLFEKAWEMRNSTFEKLPPYYMEINELLNVESNVSRLVNELLKDISLTLQKSEIVYDSITSYKWYVENAKFVESKRKTLVVSGFFDITPILRQVLKEMFNHFEDVYFYVWRKIDDRAFSQLDMIYEFLIENGFEIEDWKTEKLNLKEKTEVVGYKNVISEIVNVSGKVKKLILSGVNPSDIAIVAPNIQIAKQITEKLDEMKVPFNLSMNVKLSESKVVKMILQPFKTKYFGYDLENIFATLETPFVDTLGLTMDEIESLFKEFSIEEGDFSKSIIEKINERIKELENVEDEDVMQQVEEKKEEYLKFSKVLENLFGLFEEIDKNINGDFLVFLKKFIKEKFLDKFEVFNNEEYISIIQEEISALYKFSEVIDNLLQYNMGKTSWRNMFKILTSIVNAENYRLSPRKENAVDIVDVQIARFVEKEYKFFVSAVDGVYPSFNVNPLILQTLSEPNKLKSFNEEVERRNFVLSLIFSSHNYISYPKATLSGDPVVPSIYAAEFGEIKEESDERYILIDPEMIFSEEDKRIYEAYFGENKLILNEKFKSDAEIKRLSHSRISDYVSCPLYYYFKHVAGIRYYSQDKSNLYKGILYHRVLKNYFEKEISFNKEKIKNYVEEAYDEIYKEEFDRYKIPREINIEEFTQKLEEFIEGLFSESYLKIGRKILEIKAIKSLEEVYKTHSLFNRTVEFEARIDRIDELKENYTNFVGKKSSEVSDNMEKIDKKAYAIVDYKTKVIDYKLIEQLLLYDYVIRENKGSYISLGEADFDTYLVFLGIDDKKSYFLKREDNSLYIKRKGKAAGFDKVDYSFFKEWVESILDKILSGEFKPIFVERELEPFLNYLVKNNFEVNTSKEKTCTGYYKCEYSEACGGFEVYKDIKLAK
ncbi:MAG: hypothetical protein PWQ83_1438 [Thermosipho sp. (in: thermotogales)]|jgi:hypothetical protein|nr:hypothetical protein [Thermosipho sp. (in: thermotogales)]MDK2899548.1 hypothetical protein [Thermosipho sp. (in: thermotogales)]